MQSWAGAWNEVMQYIDWLVN